jgi:ketosteroid isomerase-like protein
VAIIEIDGQQFEADIDGDGNASNLRPYSGETDKPGNPLLAGLQSFGDAATLGYLPNIQALTEKATFPAMDLLTGGDVKADDYVNARDKYRSRQETLQEENPVASAVGTVTGIGAGLLLPVGQAARGATTGARVARSAAIGAAYGGLMNPGDKQGEMGLQLVDRAKNAALGAATGTAGEAALQGGARLLSKAPKTAERLAYKAPGPYQRDVMKLKPGEMEAIGRTNLDSGVLKGQRSLLNPLATAGKEEIAENAARAADDAGRALESLIDDIDSKISQAVGKGDGMPAIPGKGGDVVNFGVDRGSIANNVLDNLLVEEGIPGAAAKNERVINLVSEFLQGKGKMLSLRQSEELKRRIGKQIKWDRLPGADIPVEEEVNRALYSALKKGGEDAAEFAADTLGGGLKEQLVKAKQTYAHLDKTAAMAGTRASREFANRVISPSDYFVGGMGAAAAGPAGAAAALLNKGAREHGNPLLARALDKVGKTNGVPSKQRIGAYGARVLGSREQGATDDGSNPLPVAPGLLQLLLNSVPAR